MYVLGWEDGDGPRRVILECLMAYVMDVNAVGPNGRTLPHHAAGPGNMPYLEYLRAVGAVVEIQDATGQTALEIAVNADCDHVI